jgi:Cu-Zn family superoxide dismutase
MRKLIAVAAAVTLMSACASKKAETKLPSEMGGKPDAVAVIEKKSGTQVEGRAEFTKNADGTVTLVMKVKNLMQGKHAAHLHDKGDCSAEDGSSAGGHWNPHTEAHGKWGVSPHHLGDIGNIDIAPDGTGTVTLTTDKWSIGTGQPNDIVGHAVIVHADADDFVTQPTGNAGGRVGCGVVTAQ